MSHPFDEPDTDTGRGGDRFSAQEAANRRLVVVPIEYVPKVRTVRGDEPDAIRINVVDLQAQGGPKVYNGALWFGSRLIGAFRRKIGSILVGYVTKENVSGGFQAWQFISLTQDPQTVTLAQSWLQQHPEFMESCKQDIQFTESLANRGQMGDPWADANQGNSQPALPPLGAIPGTTPVPTSVPTTGPAPLPPMPQQAPVQQPLPTVVPEGTPPGAPPPQVQQLPEPGSMSVMDRLRAQAEGIPDSAPAQVPPQEQYPF